MNNKNKIEKYYNDLKEEIGEEKILWVAEVGPKIFNPDIESESQVAACILPSEEELYTTYPQTKGNVFDIRLLVNGVQSRSSTWIGLILSPYKVVNDKYKDVLQKNLFEYRELICLIEGQDILDRLKRGIKEIILFSLNSISKEEELINILTKTELKVLKNIIEDFCGNQEGDIKVSQATERYKISTAVFRTLFYKLKDYKVAQIDSRGVKGTHIKFNNLSSLNKLID